MGYSKTFFIPEAKGLKKNYICWHFENEIATGIYEWE